MELEDEIRIEAPRDKVYAGLNDLETLKECIPGCEELIKHSDTELEAKVVLKIGPVKAKFGVMLHLIRSIRLKNLRSAEKVMAALQVLPRVGPRSSLLRMAMKPFCDTQQRPMLVGKSHNWVVAL